MPTGPALIRRDLLKLCGAGAAVMAAPSVALAQAPRRGGTFTIRVWDPPHFDPYLIVAFKTQIVYSFTHNRLLKHKAGPGIQPGSFALEGDLAESWSQPDETTYIFKLRKGVRWHPKPPVNGRELTAEDVVYSLERFRTVKGNPQNYLLAMMDRAEATDRYTVTSATLVELVNCRVMNLGPGLEEERPPWARSSSAPRSTRRPDVSTWCAGRPRKKS